MAPSESQSASAAQLKDEGNALFAKKEFEAAHEKYTGAIALDGRNAVLYANRSACRLGMGRYAAALWDARKATEINPVYAKGWSRRASASEEAKEWKNAVISWQKALEALPKADLSPAEIKQKELYTASLKKAKQRLQASPKTFPVVMLPTEKRPWQAAAEMLSAVGHSGGPSGANLIYHANKDFEEGVEHMKQLKEAKDPSGKLTMTGHTDAITLMSNGVLTDARVFRTDLPDWTGKFDRQLDFECEKSRTREWIWEDVGGVQRLASERLKKEGWDSVRPALATVVHGWNMSAMVDSQVRDANHVAAERLKDIIDLLRSGRQVWKDVSKDDRGTVFEDTFIRGIQVAYLNCLMLELVHATDDNKKTLLNTLFGAANELHEETHKLGDRPTINGPTEAAFVIYPAAEAHAMLGLCHAHMGQSSTQRDQKKHFLLAVDHYSWAVKMLPEDDEKYCWYLNCAIPPSLHAGVSKKEVMGFVKKIRAAMPKMQRIWANSQLAKQDRDATIEMMLRMAEQKFM